MDGMDGMDEMDETTPAAAVQVTAAAIMERVAATGKGIAIAHSSGEARAIVRTLMEHHQLGFNASEHTLTAHAVEAAPGNWSVIVERK